MLKAMIAAGAYTSGNVPLMPAMNTNNKYEVKNNSIAVRAVGLTNVKSNIVVEATSATDISYQLYVDGEAVQGAVATVTPVAANTYTLHINDVIKAAPSYDGGYADVAFRISTECAIVGGDVILEYVR